jgi:hypothetical protein
MEQSYLGCLPRALSLTSSARPEIRSKLGSYRKIGNNNERRPNMHQQNSIYIYKVHKRNEMKKEEN